MWNNRHINAVFLLVSHNIFLQLHFLHFPQQWPTNKNWNSKKCKNIWLIIWQLDKQSLTLQKKRIQYHNESKYGFEIQQEYKYWS